MVYYKVEKTKNLIEEAQLFVLWKGGEREPGSIVFSIDQMA